MMGTIRWGIIGCGDVTEVKSGPGFQQAKNSALVAVMRRTGELAEDYARRHNVPKWYDNAAALINDPQVDAVYVATPPSSHMEYAIAAMQAGKPVYVEKPMALNFAECQAMIEASGQTGQPLFVAYYRRALARFLKIKTLLDEGVIGEVRLVSLLLTSPPHPEEQSPDTLPWRVQPEIAGGGRFVDLASHQFDFLDYALGPIQAVQGFADNRARLYPAEDVVSAAFVFESGVQGSGAWSFIAADNFDRIEIIGSAGKLIFSTFDARPITLINGAGRTEFEIEYPPHIQQPLIQTVVDELNGDGICPSPGQSAARTSWVMDQILKGYQP
jgi:predicted dehydrogenase